MKIVKFWQRSVLKNFFKNEITEDRTYFALTLATGILAALAAVSIHKITHYLTHVFKTNEAWDLKAFIFGGLAILVSGWITTRKFPSTSGSGVPGIRIALAVFHGRITFAATVAKFFTSILSLASGMSLGREGPTAAIAAGIGSSLGRMFSLSKKKVKALVAVGAAGGIAAAFNTPIAAVVFTLEEIVGDLNAKVLGAIIISSVAASVTAQALLGSEPMFTSFSYKLNNPKELFFYLGIGVACAVAGPLWAKSVLNLRSLNLKLFHGHKLTIILVSFLCMGIISVFRPEVLSSGHEAIEEVLLGMILDWRLLASLFAFKFIATSISYASGVSGGLFVPTLMMGATLGSLIGVFAKLFFPELVESIGPYALVGMGAFFVSVIRAPFTSILIVFELTRDYNIILPLMVANITSYWLSGKIEKNSIYESISEQDGIHLPSKEDHDVLESLIVEDAMVMDPLTLSSELTIKKAMVDIKEHPYSGYPVLRSGNLVGMVSTSDIGSAYARGQADGKLFDISEKKVISIYPDQSLLVAFHKLKRFNISRLPVVSRINDRKIIGIITAENIVSNFGFHIQENAHDDLETYELQFLEYQKTLEESKDKAKEELEIDKKNQTEKKD